MANQEFHRSGEILNEAAHRITRTLQDRGYRALNPSATFPMEMDRFPGRIWVVAHKPVAVAAGLGVMGIHRNVIHPRFGNFVLLGTILVDARSSALRGTAGLFAVSGVQAVCRGVSCRRDRQRR